MHTQNLHFHFRGFERLQTGTIPPWIVVGDKKALDKCYGNIKNTYTAKPKPPLSNSDYNTVQLIPTYKTVLKLVNPRTRQRLYGIEIAWRHLKDASSAQTGTYFIIWRLMWPLNTVWLPKKLVVYPNNKPYVTKSVKDCINRKKIALKNNDRWKNYAKGTQPQVEGCQEA